MKPITPAEALGIKTIPAVVFELVNWLLRDRISGSGTAKFTQEELVKLLEVRGLNREQIYRNNWLDFEPHYRNAGWKVVFDKPAGYEDYAASFTFSPKR